MCPLSTQLSPGGLATHVARVHATASASAALCTNLAALSYARCLGCGSGTVGPARKCCGAVQTPVAVGECVGTVQKRAKDARVAEARRQAPTTPHPVLLATQETMGDAPPPVVFRAAVSARLITDAVRDAILADTGTTMCRVPGRARGAWGALLRDVAHDALATGDWNPLAVAAKLILAAVPPSRAADAVIRERIAFWRAGAIGELLAKRGALRTPGGGGGTDPQVARRRRALELCADGCAGLALKTLVSMPAAPPEVTAALCKEHYGTRPASRTPAPIAGDWGNFSLEVLQKAIKIRVRSPPGPSGLRPDHVAAAGAGPRTPIARLLERIGGGEAPPWMRDANAVAIPKRDGTMRVIACGEVLRRMAARALLAAGKADLAARLPGQLVAAADGCAIAAEIAKCALAAKHTLLQVDITRAYPSVAREYVVAQSAGTSLARYAAWAYGGVGSKLHCGSGVNVTTTGGVDAGDPAAGHLFALAVQVALQHTRTVHTDVMVLFYADDGIIIGEPDNVASCFATLTLELAKLNLNPNLKKCERTGPTCAALAHIPEPQVTVVLGHPIAGDVTAFLHRKVTKAVEASEVAELLRDAQCEMLALRTAGPHARLQHLLRFVPVAAWNASDLQRADEFVISMMEHIMRTPMHTRARRQAFLPLAHGGVGVTGCSDEVANLHAYTTAAASRAERAPDVCIMSMPRLTEADARDWWPTTPHVTPPAPYAARAAALLAEAAGIADGGVASVCLRSAMEETSADFLMALPAPQLCLDLPSAAFAHALRLRLGLGTAGVTAGSLCECGEHGDANGVHRFACKYAAGLRQGNHNALRDIVYRLATRLDGAAVRIEGGLDNGTKERPGDVDITEGGPEGMRTLIDVSIRSPFAAAIIAVSAGNACAAAANGYSMKMAKYASRFAGSEVTFMPVCITTLGVYDARGLQFLTRLAKRAAAARHEGDADGSARELRHAIAVSLWRWNYKFKPRGGQLCHHLARRITGRWCHDRNEQ